jgi:hypothetical protein
VRATLDHTRVSTAIRLAKNFDYKQHGRRLPIRADWRGNIEHVGNPNILSVKESPAAGKVPRTAITCGISQLKGIAITIPRKLEGQPRQPFNRWEKAAPESADIYGPVPK